MLLPNGDRAIIPVSKLRGYALNFAHRHGRHKARVFRSALEITSANADLLLDALTEAAKTQPAMPLRWNAMGQLYQIDFEMSGPAGTARVRSGWIVLVGEDIPRLTTTHVIT